MTWTAGRGHRCAEEMDAGCTCTDLLEMPLHRLASTHLCRLTRHNPLGSEDFVLLLLHPIFNYRILANKLSLSHIAAHIYSDYECSENQGTPRTGACIDYTGLYIYSIGYTC